MSPIAFEAIVVPTDFLPGDIQLARKAVTLGQKLGTPVTLLHVIDINDQRWAKFCGPAQEFMRQLKADAEHNMKALLNALAEEGLQVTSLMVEGLPGPQILNLLHPRSLLLMERPAKKPFWRWFSKRTGQRLLEEAQSALMISHPLPSSYG